MQQQIPSSSTAGNGGGTQPLNTGVSETTIANAKQPYVHHFRIAKKKTTLEFKMVDAKDIRKNMYGAQNRANLQQQEMLFSPNNHINNMTSSEMNISNDPILSPQSSDNSSSQHQHFANLNDKSRKPRAPSLFSTNTSKITKRQPSNRRNSTIVISDPTSFLQKQLSPSNNNNNQHDTTFSQSNILVSSNKKGHPVNHNRRKSTTSLENNNVPPNNTHPQHSHSPIYNNTINSPPSTPSSSTYFTSGFSFGNSQKDEYTPPVANTTPTAFSNFKATNNNNPNDTNGIQENLYGDAYVSTLTPEQRRYLMQGARRTFATLPSIEEMTRYEMRRNSIEELTQNFSQVSTSESNNNNQRRPSTDSNQMLVISENFRNDQRFRRRQTYAFDSEHFSSYDNSCLDAFNFPCKPPPPTSTNFQNPNSASTPNNHHPQSNGTPYPSADNHPYYLPPISKIIHE